MMALLRLIGFLKISHGSNRNQQVGTSLWCGVQTFVMAWQHFDVAGYNCEEFLQY